jgi:hypothetical protein
MQYHDFARGSVWAWNLVSDVKGGTQTDGVWEQGADKTIWSEERLRNRNEFARAYITREEEEEEYIQGINEKSRNRETTRNTRVGESIILKGILEIEDAVLWIGPIQEIMDTPLACTTVMRN